MTDHDMDALLRDVGRRWQAGNQDAPAPVVEVQRPRRRALLASAAAVVAVLAVGGAVAFTGSDGHRTNDTASAGQQEAALRGTWTVVDVQPGAVSGLTDLPVITFTDDSVSVDGPCGTEPVSYSADGAALEQHPRPVFNACANPGGPGDLAVKVVLGESGPIAYRVNGTMLTLTHGGTTITLSRG